MCRKAVLILSLLIQAAIVFEAGAADTTIKGTTADSTAASLEVTNSSDTSLLYVRNDGNIGLGTKTPATLFSLKQSADGTENGFGIQSSAATGSSRWQMYLDGSNNFIHRWGATADIPLMFSTTGKVGIGATNLTKRLHVGGGGFQIEDGGNPGGQWDEKTFLMDYASGTTPGSFEWRETRFWSVGSGDVLSGGYRGRFNFYIIDGTNTVGPPHELPVLAITNDGEVGVGRLDMGTGAVEPEATFTVRQFSNAAEGGMRLTKFGTAPNDSFQMFIDPANALNFRWASTGVTPLVTTAGGNVGIGTAVPGGGSTAGTAVLSLANGTTAPAGGAANQASLYAADVASSSELFALDEAGNATQLSPHDPVTGEWVFYSKNTVTGRVVRVDMERLVRAVEQVTGEKFMVEKWEQ